MSDSRKTKAELAAELRSLRAQVTERVQAEEALRASEDALRESEERFRTTVELAAVGIANVAPDGRFLRVNQRFCDFVGYGREEILARTYRDITHPDDLEASRTRVEAVLAGAMDSFSLEKRYVRKDGAETFRELRRIRGDAAVILSSGYNEQEIVHRFAGKGLAAFVQKPYRIADLVGAVQRAFGREART